MKSATLTYDAGDNTFNGYYAYDDSIPGKKPVVLVAHAWKGQGDFARNKANELAKLGYIGFAVDLYGDGKQVSTNEDAFALMSPLFVQRSLLRDRIVAAYETASTLEHADSANMGIIGFCLGGLTAIELLRSGVNLKGAVSFHGLLGDQLGDLRAILEPNAEKLQGSLLILHGYQDPMVSQDDIVAIQTEMADADVDWQMHIFGRATHAFTNPEANDPKNGMLYDITTERRALKTMRSFFEEVFTNEV